MKFISLIILALAGALCAGAGFVLFGLSGALLGAGVAAAIRAFHEAIAAA